jgi:hypothetical protein
MSRRMSVGVVGLFLAVGGGAFLLVFASASPPLSPASIPSANTACIYENTNSGGASRCLTVGTELSNLTSETMSGSKSWNDQISSVSAGYNTKIVLWENVDFNGASITLQYDSCNNTSPHWSSMPKGWNDRASSLKVLPCDRFVPDPAPSSNQIIFYEDRDYGGISLTYDGATQVNDLTKVNTGLSSGSWNDRISAIAVGSSLKVVFYNNINCPSAGEQGTTTVSVPCLVSISWNDKISSFKILPR